MSLNVSTAVHPSGFDTEIACGFIFTIAIAIAIFLNVAAVMITVKL
jgi:hypothetical protein